jgi:hypothetical protein
MHLRPRHCLGDLARAALLLRDPPSRAAEEVEGRPPEREERCRAAIYWETTLPVDKA